ncbi:MAG TPA: RNA polymerase sigma-70 factor [Bacteroidales bacterium]|nr:RNA polymerase sigma-70 factor [Bacteroidales bacterium]
MTLPQGDYTREELDAFRTIFDTYYESIRNFVYFKTGDMSLAEDVVQEVFLKLWDKRNEIQQETVKSLLYVMAYNSVKSHFRHQKVVFEFASSAPVEEQTHEQADANIRREEMKKQLQQVLADMPERCREVFLLNRLENLTYQEIADRLGLSVKGIEKRMHEALLFIRERINYKI